MMKFVLASNNKKKIAEYEKTNQRDHSDIFFAAEKGTLIAKYIKMLRRTHYMLYWTVKLIPEKYVNF